MKTAAKPLVKQKGAAYHAIGLETLTILESIVRDQNSLHTVSSYIDDYCGIRDVCLSVSSKINLNGVQERILLRLSSDELAALENSARVNKNVIIKSGLLYESCL